MALLVDTCTFLYLISDPRRVPRGLFARLDSEMLYVSVVCLWEILIKHNKGLLRIETDGATVTAFWQAQCSELGLEIIAVDANAIRHLEQLPVIHKDPFDRLLICQAIEHGLAIVTPDRSIRQYPVKTIWD